MLSKAKSPPDGEAGAFGGKKLIIISGLPGTGKTTVAKILADFLNIKRLSTDDIQKKTSYRGGAYEKLFSLAEDLFKKDESVILDATFYTHVLRARARKLTEDQDAKFIIIEVIAKEELVEERIEERFKKGTDSSQANKRIYHLYKSKFEPVEEEKIIIRNNGSFKDLENKIRKLAERLKC